MVFGVSPAVAGVEQAADDGFPNFIQFQLDGVNLGGPDVDTVNLTTGLTATRGTGETENALTIEATGTGGSLSVLNNGVLVADDVTTLNIVGAEAVVAESGGVATIDIAAAAAPVLAFFLSASGIAFGDTQSTWAETDGAASADASWNAGTNQIEFARTGIYEVLVSSLLGFDDTAGHTVQYGIFSAIGNDIPSSLFQGSIDYQTVPAALTTLNSTTRFVEITSSGADLARDVQIQLQATGGETSYSADLAVTVRRLGDAP